MSLKKKSTKKFLIIILAIIIILVIINLIKYPMMKNVYKKEYSEYVEKYSQEYEVDTELIYAIIKAESNFNEEAQSSKGAKGLMQLMYSTAEEIALILDISLTEENILDPEININLGTKYISMLIERYNSIELALASYNAGSGNVDSWIEENILEEDGSNIENIPFKETNNYVRKILRDYDIYKLLYEQG